MKKVLWLDDTRNPFEPKWDKYISERVSGSLLVEWVKSYREFVREITTDSLPDYIFFDHDLGIGKSGMDCMKFLVSYIQDNELDPYTVAVLFQTSNPVGRENMESLFNSYKDYYSRSMQRYQNFYGGTTIGLDSYFERIKKRDVSDTLKSSDWESAISYTGNEFQELKRLAESEGTSFSSLLCRAVSNYLSEHDGYETRDEVKYFRKFHFLNTYFKYDDDW